jgi:serine/threonine-protein kinase
MGAVYKASDPMMDRTVAIKTILSGALSGPMADEYRERFTREARAAGRLTHPGIVTVYDVGDFNGTPYLVMEFVDGRSLATAMDSGVRFSFDHIYEMGRQLADALGYAHRNGVIHRDIKPANILLASGAPGEPEHAKIADLGVAKLSASQITTTGQLLGTPAFMPPEQFTGETIDGRADLFSLGVILYWLATGDKPFAGDTITAVSYKIVHSSPAPPRRINPAVPVVLEQIIMKCLEKDPAQRYLTGEALAADLAAGRAGRTTATQGVGTSQSASETLMAPVSMMEGDPNTTLDSDARVQMAARGQAAATKTRDVAPGKPGLLQNTSALIGIAAAVLVLAGGIATWRVIHHRNVLRAEAEAADQLKQEQDRMKAEADALAKQQAQNTLNGSSPTTTDQTQGSTPTGAPPNTSTNPPAGSATNALPSSQPPAPGTRGSTPDKKSATKTPAKGIPPKTPANSGPAPNSTATNQQQQQPPNSPTSQTQTNPSQPSTPSTTPPKTSSPDSTAQPPTAPNSGTPNAAPVEAAKIHIDTGRVPLAASFVVMMDGKVFFQRKPLGEHDPDPTRDDITVPPGDHEFRVITAEGGIHVGDSNAVRANFPSKKKMLLHIDIRDNSSGQMMKKTSKLEPDKADFLISVKAPNLLGF